MPILSKQVNCMVLLWSHLEDFQTQRVVEVDQNLGCHPSQARIVPIANFLDNVLANLVSTLVLVLLVKCLYSPYHHFGHWCASVQG